MPALSHGESAHNRTKLYIVWGNIIQRCYNKSNPAYKHYGGRGITMCDEWRHSYEAFKNWAMDSGYKEELQIDRIDNDKGYYPENCQWIEALDNNVSAKKRIRVDNTSGYEGISRALAANTFKWRVRLTIAGNEIYYEGFNTLFEAVIARNAFIKEHKLESKFRLQNPLQAMVDEFPQSANEINPDDWNVTDED